LNLGVGLKRPMLRKCWRLSLLICGRLVGSINIEGHEGTLNDEAALAPAAIEDDDVDIVLNSNYFTQDRKRQAKTKADLNCVPRPTKRRLSWQADRSGRVKRGRDKRRYETNGSVY
jgi:hypothetical protein